jgi:hypothetical protein
MQTQIIDGSLSEFIRLRAVTEKTSKCLCSEPLGPEVRYAARVATHLEIDSLKRNIRSCVSRLVRTIGMGAEPSRGQGRRDVSNSACNGALRCMLYSKLKFE